jgi:hypoxanthine phosphoribosyltransferase
MYAKEGIALTMSSTPTDLTGDIAEVLFTEERIAQRVAELAATITTDYLPRWQADPGWSLCLVSVLRGSVFFGCDLARALRLPVTMDYMAVASYGSSGRVQIVKDLQDDIQGRDVLVVEDIIDSGLTIGYLLSQLRARQPRSLAVVTLIDRSGLRLVHDLPVPYTGFDVKDLFVVGYGLDFRERYRNLPFIGLLREDVMAETTEPRRFAHPSEEDFARLLDFYRIKWEYEPRTFVLRENEDGTVKVGFSPDFYLPEFDLYIEVTTKKPHLMNRKLRQIEALRLQHPGLRIELMDRADFAHLAKKLKPR